MAREHEINTVVLLEDADNPGGVVRAQGNANGVLIVGTGIGSGITGVNKSYKDATFTSTTTHDVNTDLARNGTRGYIHNFGLGEMSFQLSFSGSTFGEAISLPVGGIVDFAGLSIDQIKVVYIVDTSYEIVVW